MKTAEPHGHYIDLDTRDGAAVRTFVVEPRQAARAVVVVLQHMDQRRPGSAQDRLPVVSVENRPGVNPHARHMCEAFAREGFLALAPSTFGRGVSGTDYGYRLKTAYGSARLAAPLQALPSPQVMHDIDAAIRHAGRVAPNLGVVMAGFCWGGLLAWRAAAQFKQLRACVSHYPGGIEGESERALELLCPVLVQCATDPRWMPRAGIDGLIRAQQARAPAAPIEWEVHEARYGFIQQQQPSYSEAAFGAAWKRTVAFLSARAGMPG